MTSHSRKPRTLKTKKRDVLSESGEIIARDEDFEDEEQSENEVDFRTTSGDFADLIVAPSDWTIETLSRQIGKQIDLDPEFQRRGVWNAHAKSSFIESLLLNIPIPQVLLAAKQTDRNSFIVLDGKQRLLTIRQFLNGEYEDGRPFFLKDMRILRELEGLSWDQLRHHSVWSDSFLNQTIRTAVLRGWKSEDVLYEIFHRLNSGSVKLSPMELRTSLHPGPFLKGVVKWTETPRNLHKLLRLKGPDKRMGDVELVVRYLGFLHFSARYRGNLKSFLDDTSQEFNVQYQKPTCRTAIEADLANMEAAISLDMDVFGFQACRKWKDNQFDTRFNRALFDVQVSSLADTRVQRWLGKDEDKRGKLRQAFIDLSRSDPAFVSAVETTTKSLTAVIKRFTAWYAAVKHVSHVPIEPPVIGNEASN